MIRVDETDPVGEIEPAFPYRDVTVRRKIEFKDYYDLESELGRGKFGTVHLCKDKKNGLKLAAKIVNTIKKEDRRAVEREVEIMRRLQHPRLIQLYDAIDTGKQFYVILELIEGGELFERVIDDDFVLTERSCAVFMRQICEGIEFVHAQNILHLDMKPENILCLTKEGNRIKIIDFGLARQFDPRKKLQVLFGTPEFVAPEVVNFDQIGFGTDMWSIGVICYVLLSGLSPFMGDTDVETMANVTIAKYDFDHEAFSGISEEAKDFIRCLLIKDREKRMTASQCRSCGWLARRNSPKDISEAKKFVGSSEKHTKLKADNKSTSSDENSKNALDLSKDNLRLFVERWREHPNSPYRLEETSGYSDSIRNIDSTSLRADSPSPPQSIHSDGSEFSEACGNSRDKLWPAIPNITHERRASEGNFNDLHVRDPVLQITLAEEIIKLSKHLRTIATESQAPISTLTNLDDEQNERGLINVELPTEVHEKNKIPKNIAEITQYESNYDDECNNKQVNEIYEKISKIKLHRKLNGTTFNGTKNFDKQENISRALQLKKSLSIVNRKDSLNNEMVCNENKKSEESWQSELQKKLGVDENSHKQIDLMPPWRRTSRVKRRFSETCRDVPRISNLRDIHKNMNLDEPTSTKNLLLKLLEEWDERPNSHVFGRKSISVDWDTENITRQSINSLAQYFQSKQNKTTNSPLQRPSTSTYR